MALTLISGWKQDLCAVVQMGQSLKWQFFSISIYEFNFYLFFKMTGRQLLERGNVWILKIRYLFGGRGGGRAQLVSRPPLKLGTQVWIPVGAWLGSPNAWMRGEEITSCKSHIASVNLTDWHIMIVFVFLFFFNVLFDKSFFFC